MAEAVPTAVAVVRRFLCPGVVIIPRTDGTTRSLVLRGKMAVAWKRGLVWVGIRGDLDLWKSSG